MHYTFVFAAASTGTTVAPGLVVMAVCDHQEETQGSNCDRVGRGTWLQGWLSWSLGLKDRVGCTLHLVNGKDVGFLFGLLI